MLDVTPVRRLICTPADALFDATLSVLTIPEIVSLSVEGIPAGASASFAPNNFLTPANSVLMVSNLGAAAPGWYGLNIVAIAPTRTAFDFTGLHVATLPSAQALPAAPANGATGVSRTPTLAWTGFLGGSYTVHLARDPAFASIVAAVLVYEPLYEPPVLAPLTEYYWRVLASNGCGSAAFSQVFSFTTGATAGDCPAGRIPVSSYASDFESHAATNTTMLGLEPWTAETIAGLDFPWELSAKRTRRGVVALHANAFDFVTDERLRSPPMSLPADRTRHRLKFWNYQSLESNGATACWDGAILEISNDGASWVQLDAELLTDPYDGPVAALGGVNGWCGDPQDWTQTVVDVDAWAGQTVQFGLRVATDSSVSREGWYVDDFRLQGCATEGIFASGFE